MTGPERRSEEHRVSAAADLEDVWRLLTTAEGLASWFGTEASIDLRVGGAYEIGWGSDERIVGEVAEIDEGRRLRISYLMDGEEGGGEEWLLSHSDGVTVIRLIHSMPDPGVEDWDGWYGDFRRGWRMFLAGLRFAAECPTGPDRVVSSTYVPAPSGREPTWRALAHELRDRPPGDGFATAIEDRPHQLLLTDASSTVLVDLEGDGDGLVCYVQAASHGPDRAGAASQAWRADLLARLSAAVPG
ncbi:MAG: SRPBCC domain-containing protein [Actinomycetota bacterium]